jgi:hypothetical protein
MAEKKEKVLSRLDEVRSERIDWLWPDRLAPGLALLDGDPGVGKSLLTLDLAARLTTARAFPDGWTPAAPMTVLLLGREDSLHSVVIPRLQAAEADLSRVHVLAVRSNPTGQVRLPVFPDDCDLLQEAIVEQQVRLVVIDPLLAFLSMKAYSLNDQLVRQALDPLAQLAEDTRATLSMIRHLTKSGASLRASQRGTGAVSISASSRNSFLVGVSPLDESLRVFARCKNSYGVAPPSLGFRIESTGLGQPRVVWTGPVDLSADDLLLSGRLYQKEARERAKELLQGVLANGPCSRDDITRQAMEAGIAERTLRRAKEELGILSQQSGTETGKRWFWSLPARTAALDVEPWGEERERQIEMARAESKRFFDELYEKHKDRPVVASGQ